MGESGSGKTTVAQAIVGLVPRDRGELQLRDQELAPDVGKRTRTQQAAMRMVFQNPTASLNPKLAVRHAIVRALRKFSGLNKRESRQRAGELLAGRGAGPWVLEPTPWGVERGRATARGPGRSLRRLPGHHRSRRSGLRIGRVRPSPSTEPASVPSTGNEHVLCIHHPRPWGWCVTSPTISLSCMRGTWPSRVRQIRCWRRHPTPTPKL